MPSSYVLYLGYDSLPPSQSQITGLQKAQERKSILKRKVRNISGLLLVCPSFPV